MTYFTRLITTTYLEVANGKVAKKDYACLTDRVRKNKGEKILYGTQLKYRSNGQAIPLPTEDSLGVDERRKEMNLPPLNVYLNEVTNMHYQRNQEYLQSQGINAPVLHPN